jgi:hypothetical protein
MFMETGDLFLVDEEAGFLRVALTEAPDIFFVRADKRTYLRG